MPCTMRYAGAHALLARFGSLCMWVLTRAAKQLFNGYDRTVGDHFELIGC